MSFKNEDLRRIYNAILGIPPTFYTGFANYDLKQIYDAIIAGGGGGGMGIGLPISGADPNRVLFSDAAGILNQDPLFNFDNLSKRMYLGEAVGNTARLNMRGFGTTAATFAQVVKDSAGNDTMQIRDDAAVKFGGGSFGHPTNTRFQINNGLTGVFRIDNNTLFTPDTIVSLNTAPLTISGQTTGIRLQPENGNTGFINIGNAKVNTVTIATGTRKHIEINQGYISPNSPANSVTVNQVEINPSINMNNQLGTKIFRGIYHNPTLTGTIDNRAFESVSGGGYFNTSSVNASAILQADSTTKGFLPPRMTNAQILAIATPAAGLMAYNTNQNHVCFYDGTAWQKISHTPM